MTLPNFLVIGSAKCATTAICHHLTQHPEICFSKPKEPFFFTDEKRWRQGPAWYERCFAHSNGEPAVGEGSTHYTLIESFPNTISRIRAVLGAPKIVFCVRHPYERIQSEWVELHSQGLTMKPFNEDLRANPWYIDGSMYDQIYTSYCNEFGEDNIHCVFFDDFKSNPSKTIADLFRFIGVRADFQPAQVGKKIYGSEGKRADRPLVNLLRRSLPGFIALRNAAPPALRAWAKERLKAPIEGHPSWDPEARAWASERISDNVAQFLHRMRRDELAAHWLETTP